MYGLQTIQKMNEAEAEAREQTVDEYLEDVKAANSLLKGFWVNAGFVLATALFAYFMV